MSQPWYQTTPVVSISLSGEVSTKSSGTRRNFVRRLRSNLRQALADHGLHGHIIDRRDRIDIEHADDGAAEVAARVFGVQAVRRAFSVAGNKPEAVCAAGVDLFGDQVAGRRFAVRPRRVGNRRHVSLSPTELARTLGQALVDAGGQVDLDDPEVCVHAEIRAHDVLLFDQPLPGPGGLPIGTEGHGLALISGGFDSAVAAWRMLLRGMDLDFVLFNLAGWPQEKAAREVLEILEHDWMAGSRSRLHVVDFRPLVADMRRHVRGSYWQVLLKRMMMHAAEQIAREIRAEALVTGEVVGQVSSQTLSNLRAITAHTEIPVLRPLVGLNKDEIVAEAQRIGTHDVCARTAEFCALDGGRPVTRCKPGQLDRHEAVIGRETALELAGQRRILARDAFSPPEHDSAALDHVPDEIAVIDLRSEHEYRQWAWPGAIHLQFDKALAFAQNLPADRRYLFYCEFGLKSAFLAERMREIGYDAWYFAGGIRALKDRERQPSPERRSAS